MLGYFSFYNPAPLTTSAKQLETGAVQDHVYITLLGSAPKRLCLGPASIRDLPVDAAVVYKGELRHRQASGANHYPGIRDLKLHLIIQQRVFPLKRVFNCSSPWQHS